MFRCGGVCNGMNLVFFALGLTVGVFCAVGEILFDWKGKGNRKFGTSGKIDSNWSDMAGWRFGASILAAFLGVSLSLIHI